MSMFFWKRRPTSKEVVDAVIAKYVTPEQMEKLEKLLVKKDVTMYEQIIEAVSRMKPRYSMKKCLEIAEGEIRCLNLNNPSLDDRRYFGYIFLRELLKG